MAKAKTIQNEVTEFIDGLDHPLKDEITQLRKLVLEENNHLTEHIKWNAPSFCIDGEDCITMKLFPSKHIQLIFHRGAKPKKPLDNKHIKDEPGLLKWAANDRAVATINNLEDLEQKEKPLRKVINQWITAIKKRKD